MGYSYSPESRDEAARAFFGKRGRHLAIAAVVVFFIGIFYVVGNTVTTYATYNKALENQLNTTQIALVSEQEQKEQCEALLGESSSKLSACNSDITVTLGKLDSCNNNAAMLTRDVNDLSNKSATLSRSLDVCNVEKTSSLEAYRQLARSSVKAICCSFGDVQSGLVRNWNITTNNSIMCSGNYTINCTSGESNY